MGVVISYERAYGGDLINETRINAGYEYTLSIKLSCCRTGRVD